MRSNLTTDCFVKVERNPGGPNFNPRESINYMHLTSMIGRDHVFDYGNYIAVPLRCLYDHPIEVLEHFHLKGLHTTVVIMSPYLQEPLTIRYDSLVQYSPETLSHFMAVYWPLMRQYRRDTMPNRILTSRYPKTEDFPALDTKEPEKVEKVEPDVIKLSSSLFKTKTIKLKQDG